MEDEELIEYPKSDPWLDRFDEDLLEDFDLEDDMTDSDLDFLAEDEKDGD